MRAISIAHAWDTVQSQAIVNLQGGNIPRVDVIRENNFAHACLRYGMPRRPRNARLRAKACIK